MDAVSRGARMHRFVRLLLALCCAAAILFIALVWGLESRGARSVLGLGHRFTEVMSKGGSSAAIDLPPALLCEYYEHGFEHAPPRDPSGVMQRREIHYTAPPDPLELMSSKLTGEARDQRLLRLMSQWQAGWLKGYKTSESMRMPLQEAAGRCSLNAGSLLDVARGLEFLEGNEVAAAFFHAALAKAESQFAGMQPGDPAALPFLHELDQTKALWRLSDYPALERRYRLARRLYPPLSVEARRSGYLLADTLFSQHRFQEAADVIAAVQAEHRRVGDLGRRENSDIPEMNYEVGYLLFCAQRFEEAIPFLRRVGGGEHAQEAGRALFSALLHSGHLEQARQCFSDLRIRCRLSRQSQAIFASELQEAEQNQQWRQEAMANSN